MRLNLKSMKSNQNKTIGCNLWIPGEAKQNWKQPQISKVCYYGFINLDLTTCTLVLDNLAHSSKLLKRNYINLNTLVSEFREFWPFFFWEANFILISLIIGGAMELGEINSGECSKNQQVEIHVEGNI